MKKILILNILVFPFLVHAQSLINNGAFIKVNGGADFRVSNASIINKNSGTIDNKGKLYLDGNFDQNTAASYIGDATSWLWFETNAAVQTINATNVARLRVENGNTLQLLADLTVSNDVDFMNNGHVQLGNFNLIANNATLSNYGLSSHVVTNGIGVLQRTMNSGDVKIFPVGNNSYNPVSITNTGTTDDFQIRVGDVVYDNGTTGTPETDHVVNRSWYIRETVTGGSISDITVEWDQSEELTFDRINCGLAHWNGSIWEHPTMSNATNVGGTRWTQTRMGQTTFSPFAVEDLNVDLPVELLSFDAKRTTIGQVKLNWVTASEINNQGFDVERMLGNETTFTKVAWVDGNGTSIDASYYAINDDNGFNGVSYYRLRQVDFDGTATYSPIKAVENGDGLSDGIDIFPNPVHDYINIRVLSEAKEAVIKIYDSKGSEILSTRYVISTSRLIEIDNITSLTNGVYLISITTETGNVFTQKFVKEQR